MLFGAQYLLINQHFPRSPMRLQLLTMVVLKTSLAGIGRRVHWRRTCRTCFTDEGYVFKVMTNFWVYHTVRLNLNRK